MPDDHSLPLDHEPLNRAERRAARFHQRTGKPDPHAITAPVADQAPAQAPDGHAEASATTGSGDSTDRGAGTGGASESATRKSRHEGSHAGVTPKG